MNQNSRDSGGNSEIPRLRQTTGVAKNPEKQLCSNQEKRQP